MTITEMTDEDLITVNSEAATLPRNLYYDTLQLNYYIREAFAMAELLIIGG